MKKSQEQQAKTLDHWSYSSWAQMQKCAYAYHCKFILGMKETGSSPALERGIKLHKASENYLKQDTDKLPGDLHDFRLHYKELRALNPVVEKFWGVDKRWRPVNYQSWVVMKMDAAVPPSKKTNGALFIIDLKTGKEYPGHRDQASLYAAIGSAIFPKATSVIAEFWYADGGYPAQFEFSQKQVQAAIDKWQQAGRELLVPRTKYLPSPSQDNCKYCFLRSDKGGPCTAWKKVIKTEGYR